MKVNLSIGEVIVGCKHVGADTVQVHVKIGTDMDLVSNSVPMRGTHVWVRFPDDLNVEERSICKPPDNFNKKVGRRLAANRLMDRLRCLNVLSKEDRRKVFQAICPEYK